MARIAGVDLPNNKRGEIGLTYIYGIGRSSARDAPMVGTFYAASAPEQPPFVKVGDRVRKGQPVCLLEAMKMMSEIPAPCDCEITAVLKENGALVSFGEPLFRYQPC